MPRQRHFLPQRLQTTAYERSKSFCGLDQRTSLSPARRPSIGYSDLRKRSRSKRYHCLMRSEDMREIRRRLVNVILFQARGSSWPQTLPLGHVAPDSATCRTAASSARSARVAMALRSHREPLTNLGTESIDPIWVRTGKHGI